MNRFDTARRFAATCKPSISGARGHDRLFAVACKLVQYYRLDLHEVWTLVQEYNKRCAPPWSKGELIHKITDAFRKVGINYNEAQIAASVTYLAPEVTRLTAKPLVSAGRHQRPDPSGFGPGTAHDLYALARLRSISVQGVELAHNRGVLVFGQWHGLRVYGLTDQSGRALEIRRLDGELFEACGDLQPRKSHAVRGSNKRWPVGILESQDVPNVALVEGIPDLIACHDAILREHSDQRNCAPVAMLCANAAIDEEALPYFRGKFIRIFFHNDANGAGWKGAVKWQRQLVKAGAYLCDFFRFDSITSVPIKDFNDFVSARSGGLMPETGKTKILPCYAI